MSDKEKQKIMNEASQRPLDMFDDIDPEVSANIPDHILERAKSYDFRFRPNGTNFSKAKDVGIADGLSRKYIKND